MTKIYHIIEDYNEIWIESDYSYSLHTYYSQKHHDCYSESELLQYLHKQSIDELEYKYAIYKCSETIEEDLDSSDFLFQCDVCNEIFDESLENQICSNCAKHIALDQNSNESDEYFKHAD